MYICPTTAGTLFQPSRYRAVSIVVVVVIMPKHIVTIFGATGTQGGSVVKRILSTPSLAQKFSLRGITRNTSSNNAKSLASQGVEVVSADLNNPSSLDKAVQGSYAVFAVTNYWETGSAETEIRQGKAIADACAAAGVKHVVWSKLYNIKAMTNGVLNDVAHFDSKADIADYFDSIKKDANMIVTHFLPGFYMSNFTGANSMLQRNPQVNNGKPTIMLPWDSDRTQVPLFDAGTDTGIYVAAILGSSDPAALDGKNIHAVSEWTTPTKIARDMGEVLGQQVYFNQVSEQMCEEAISQAMGPKAAHELTENMILVRDYSYYGKGSEKKQAESDKILEPLGFKTTSFKAFLKNAGQL